MNGQNAKTLGDAIASAIGEAVRSRIRLRLLSLAIFTLGFALGFQCVGCTFDDGGAQRLAVRPPDGADAGPPDAPQTTILLTEESSGDVVPGDSIWCGSGTDAWFRAFALSDFGVTGPLYTTRVHFTSELTKNANDVTLALYSYTGEMGAASLDLAQMTPLAAGSVTGDVPDAGGPEDGGAAT